MSNSLTTAVATSAALATTGLDLESILAVATSRAETKYTSELVASRTALKQRTSDVEKAAETLRPGLAFSLGAMGSRQHNFYNNAYSRQGYADEAKEIQRLWLSGKRDEARARVPLDLIIGTNLIGDEAMVKQRLRDYRNAGVTTFRPGLHGDTFEERMQSLGRLMDLVREVSAEPAVATR